MVVITLASNIFLKSFVDSKPAGRKTVLGNTNPIVNVTDSIYYYATAIKIIIFFKLGWVV